MGNLGNIEIISDQQRQRVEPVMRLNLDFIFLFLCCCACCLSNVNGKCRDAIEMASV